MAVSRITLSAPQYKVLIKRLQPHVGQNKDARALQKELKRAPDRRSLMAEVTPRELQIMLDLVSDMPDLDAYFRERIAECEDVERQEREGAARIKARMDQVRGAVGGA